MPSDPVCRLTGTPLTVVLDLGRQPLGNGFLDPVDFDSEYFYHLRCGFAEDSCLFQLVEQPSPELMFHHDYAFFSSTSRHMQEHFAAFAEDIRDRGYVDGDDPLVVEIGSNDGIFLKHFSADGVRHLGIEPSGAVADKAVESGVKVCREFFDVALASRILDEHGPASVISAANVMCHIPGIHELAQGIALLLGDDGILVFEDPYLGDVVRLTSYDQIYDEHVFLFSALSVQNIFRTVGMELIDLVPQATHGGSMRYFLTKEGRRVPSPTVQEILDIELAQGLDRTETFVELAERVAASAVTLRRTLEEIRAAGKTIAAYGATSKSTTIYNYAGIGPDLIDFICDNTPLKQERFSPGVHIPILPESAFRMSPLDYAFLAAWNHEAEIRSHNAPFEAAGGKWISHVPEARILD